MATALHIDTPGKKARVSSGSAGEKQLIVENVSASLVNDDFQAFDASAYSSGAVAYPSAAPALDVQPQFSPHTRPSHRLATAADLP